MTRSPPTSPPPAPERPAVDAGSTLQLDHESRNAIAAALVNLEVLRTILGDADEPLSAAERATCSTAVHHAQTALRALLDGR